jgi:hypothetical protein
MRNFTTASNAMLTIPFGINNAGQMVGYFQGPIGDQGFLKSGDTYSIIAVPGGTDTKPYGINNAGQIVGTFLGTATYQGFVATPVVVDMSPPLMTVSASPATLSPRMVKKPKRLSSQGFIDPPPPRSLP